MRENIDIKHLSKLANLELNDDDLAGYKNDLNRIVDFISIIEEYDLDENHEKEDFKNTIFRSDIPKDNINRKEAFRNAQKVQDDYFVVPKILDNK